MNKQEALIKVSEIIDEAMIDKIRLIAQLDRHNNEYSSELNLLKEKISGYVILREHLKDYLK